MIKKIFITALCSVAVVFGAAAYPINANATTIEDVIAEARYWGYPESDIQLAYNAYLSEPEGMYGEEEFEMAIDKMREYGHDLFDVKGYFGITSPDSPTEPTTEPTTDPAEEPKPAEDPSANGGEDQNTDAENNITLTMPDGTTISRISKEAFIKLSFDEKLAYIQSFPPEQQQFILDNLSPEERRSVLKQLPTDKKAEIVNNLSGAMKEVGLNISVDSVEDDSIKLAVRNDDGKLLAAADTINHVEETGYDRRGVFAFAGALFAVSATGLFILIRQTFNRKGIGEENE
jgi:hypothetical protein rflaF_10930